jgi:hypothetical protein
MESRLKIGDKGKNIFYVVDLLFIGNLEHN